MDTNQLPTVDEFCWNGNMDFKEALAEINYQYIQKLMIDFAKLHVQAALLNASEKAELTEFASEFLQEGANNAIDKDSILSSYQLENIK